MSEARKKSERIVWLDMEMTGLWPESCVPIEVAAIITEGDLSELGMMEAIIHQPEGALENMIPVVREMHTKNGLLERVRASSTTLQEADEELAALIAEYCEPGKAVLAGNTIHQDRLFIRRYFPESEKTLHYRMIDVSSIKELVKRWYGEDKGFSKSSDHTAAEDIRSSIRELRYYRQHCFTAEWSSGFRTSPADG